MAAAVYDLCGAVAGGAGLGAGGSRDSVVASGAGVCGDRGGYVVDVATDEGGCAKNEYCCVVAMLEMSGVCILSS